MRYPSPWSWTGVALVLAIAIGGGWLAGVVFTALGSAREVEIDVHVIDLLNGIGQVLAGALATYLGFAVGITHRALPAPPPPPSQSNPYPNE